MNEVKSTRGRELRLWVQFNGGSWSCGRGAVLVASGLPAVTEAWQAIEPHAAPPADQRSDGRARNSTHVRWRR